MSMTDNILIFPFFPLLPCLALLRLVLVCRLVCCQWRNLVDGAALWVLKCQQEGLTRAESDVENWQSFYFLSKKRRNLIKNPCGEEGLEHWGEVENGGDGWKIEELPGDFGKEFPSEEVHKYFVTSYEWCRKAQVIDLRAEGYWEELMDTILRKALGTASQGKILGEGIFPENTNVTGGSSSRPRAAGTAGQDGAQQGGSFKVVSEGRFIINGKNKETPHLFISH
uniref:FBA domain-containing protein n=1 Tax=Zonotrichia albicollis TaxID=44394 RepID=A0A8D2N237_ZONAL